MRNPAPRNHASLSASRIFGKAARALPVLHQHPPQVTDSSLGEAEAHAEFDILANAYALVKQSYIKDSLSPNHHRRRQLPALALEHFFKPENRTRALF